MFVESFSGALEDLMSCGHGGMQWSEVPQQRPVPAVFFTGGIAGEHIQSTCALLVHPPQQAIKHVAGAVTVRMVEGTRPQVPLATQVQHFVLNGSRRHCLGE